MAKRKTKSEDAGAAVRAALNKAVRERAGKTEKDEKKAASRVKSSIRKASKAESGTTTSPKTEKSEAISVAIERKVEAEVVSSAVEKELMAEKIGTHPPHEEDTSILTKELGLFGPTNLDLAVFCRQLATLIEVGIPLLKALQMLSKRTPNPKLAKAIGRVASQVEGGQNISDAIREHEYIFTPLICNVIKVGESGGILEASLVRLAQIMESRADVNRKVYAAMLYPAAALGVAFIVVAIIMLKAVPIFTAVYAEAGADLPPITQMIIGLSDFTVDFFFVWAPALILAIGGFLWYSRTPEGRRFTSFVGIYIPPFSRITRKISVARFSRTLASLLASGVPLVECLSICADTHENAIVGDELRRVHQSVEKGDRMSRPLAQSSIFPPLVNDMIGIGEETGTLDRMLDRIADIYEAEVDANLRGLSSIIEPVLIVLLGGVVILIALAVMLPYFNLVDLV